MIRLLESATQKLVEFGARDTPPYAILSHTWGPKDYEVLFQDLQDETPPTWKGGYQKVLDTCLQARKDDLPYVWIDSCCIDKSNQAELSEAINSMYRWYEGAHVCYVYLDDVNWRSGVSFCQSKWFTRGWTLQELLAPCRLIFFTSDWHAMGTRFEMADGIKEACGIDSEFLVDDEKNGYKVRNASIAQRMSWASYRKTTREEDVAYCLLGIFGINLPLIYGEGLRGAFFRLQEEILRQSDDQTIFAWSAESVVSEYNRWASRLLIPKRSTSSNFKGVLAESPSAFRSFGDVVPISNTDEALPGILTSRGIQLEVRMFTNKEGHRYGIFPCRRKSNPTSLLAIRLILQSGQRYCRESDGRITWVHHRQWFHSTAVSAILVTRGIEKRIPIPPNSFLLRSLPRNMVLTSVSGDYVWDESTQLIKERAPRNVTKAETSLSIRFDHVKSSEVREVILTVEVRQFGPITWRWCYLSSAAEGNWPHPLRSQVTVEESSRLVLYAMVGKEDVLGETFFTLDIISTSRSIYAMRLRVTHMLNYSIWLLFRLFDSFGGWLYLFVAYLILAYDLLSSAQQRLEPHEISKTITVVLNSNLFALLFTGTCNFSKISMVFGAIITFISFRFNQTFWLTVAVIRLFPCDLRLYYLFSFVIWVASRSLWWVFLFWSLWGAMNLHFAGQIGTLGAFGQSLPWSFVSLVSIAT